MATAVQFSGRTKMSRLIGVRSLGAAALLFGLMGGLAGCQADFAADVTNRTPQPVTLNLVAKGDTNGGPATLTKRLGPGDRGTIGPLRCNKNKGAYLAADTLGNPSRPLTVDLAPGQSFFELRQDGTGTTGPLILIQK